MTSRESIEAFVRAVDAFSEYDLLDVSRCHGWTRLDVAVHVLAGGQEMLGGLVSECDSDPTVDAATYWPAFAGVTRPSSAPVGHPCRRDRAPSQLGFLLSADKPTPAGHHQFEAGSTANGSRSDPAAWEAADVASSEVWDEETAAKYDADAAGHFAPDVLDPTVDFLERLAEDGPALEFAIGTGRVGIPLAARGVAVTGIELSKPMVAQLRRKVDEEQIPVLVGDMATAVVPGAGRFSLVYLVWNGISNLRTQAEQVQCFANAAHHLRPSGRFVIELWVPPIQRLLPGEEAVPMSVDEGHIVFDTYDLVTQACTSHHYHRDVDGSVRYETGHFRYIWPAECDLMAQLASFELESRSADWKGSPFLATSDSHVSVWRKV